MSDQFQDILTTIKENKATITAYSPSKSKKVKFYPLTLSQQKQIIETAGDPTLSILAFNKLFYNILKENIIDDDINQYNTVDRVVFTLALRAHLSDEVELEDESKISLLTLINRNVDIKPDLNNITITANEFVFECAAPTLDIDNKINDMILKKHKKINDDTLSLLISDLYVYEILKFIKTLSVGERTINFEDNYVQALELLNNIDSKLLIDIADFINKVRDAESEFAKIPDSDSNIDIVPNFFIL